MKQEKIEQLLKKIENFKKGYRLDLSSGEDLSIAVMNLISLEEHLFFTGAKTGKDRYYKLLDDVREIRKDLLGKIVKDKEGEVWCISKHLLAASMRCLEVGTKYYNQKDKKQAKDLFTKAYDLYSLFWGINLELVGGKNNKGSKQVRDNKIMADLNSLVEKLVNCCEE